MSAETSVHRSSAARSSTAGAPDTSASVERLVHAPASRVWGLLSDPAQHHRFDDTGMVGRLASEPPRGAGDVFRMHMTYRDGETVEHYQSDNHVVRFEPERAMAWATAFPDGAPLGWSWTYQLVPQPSGTLVRLTYDWTDTPAENVRRFGVPLTDAAGLARSLDLLAAQCEDDA